MKYKLLALDLDGTLLNSDKKISQKNYAALNKFCSIGGQVIVVTGRGPKTAMECVNLIERHAHIKVKYLVSYTGAYLFDNIKKKVLEINPIDLHWSKKLFEIAKEKKAIYWQNTLSGASDNLVSSTNSLISKSFVKFANFNMKLSNDYVPDQVYKANFIAYTPWKITMIENYLKTFFKEHYETFRTSKWTIEVTKKGVNKGAAIRKIAKLEKIKLKEIVAIGDSMNDYSTFQTVGAGIAVKNAMHKLKKISKKVVASKNKSGVSEAIDLIINDEV